MAEEIDQNRIVDEIVAEANLPRDLLLPEEIDYLRERALHKPLRVVHIWSLGVGAVITGMYFGWNYGLPAGGPIGMLIASLIVCVLYLTWVLGLSELSVAMPFAGGPLAYGRRAVGKGFGFLMGWSMFLECLFAAIGTALATGSNVVSFAYGGGSYIPVNGDWDGDGSRTVGVYDPSTGNWYLRNSNTAGAPKDRKSTRLNSSH